METIITDIDFGGTAHMKEILARLAPPEFVIIIFIDNLDTLLAIHCFFVTRT